MDEETADRDTDEAMEEWLDNQTTQMSQGEKVDALVGEVRRLKQRVDDLEQEVEEQAEAVQDNQDLVRKLNQGEIGGEQGAQLLLSLAPDPDGTVSDARVRQIYHKIVEHRLVGTWVKTDRVKKWLNLEHNTQVHRVMDDLVTQCSKGILLGHAEKEKRHGTWCIRLTGSQGEQDDS